MDNDFDNDIDFNSPIYQVDPRFTADLTVYMHNKAFCDDLLEQQKMMRETGRVFFGHSSAELVERALGMDAGTLATTYDWPVPLAHMTPPQRHIAVSHIAFNAYEYVHRHDAQTRERLGLPLDFDSNGPDSNQRMTHAHQHAFRHLQEVNAALVQRNPALKPAYDAMTAYVDEGFSYNALNFLHGVLFRFPAEDIALFQHTNGTGFFQRPYNETNTGIDIWPEVTPYLFRDVNAGWVLSKASAEKIMNAVIALKADGVPPTRPQFYDPAANYPFQQAFERRVAQKHAEYLAMVAARGGNDHP